MGPNGKLLDASQIVWVNDLDDDEPVTTSVTTLNSFVTKVPPVDLLALAL